MGMPCIVNSVLKLSPAQGYPALSVGTEGNTIKDGYRIIPMDVPVMLVDDAWVAHADVVIHTLTWANQTTAIAFTVVKLYDDPLKLK